MSPKAELVAAWWALRAVRVARRGRARVGIEAVVLPPVPHTSAGAYRAVRAVLLLTRQRCLVESLVRQAWFLAHGRSRDLVVGVTAPSAGFRAHAWLEGDPAPQQRGFREILRLPPEGQEQVARRRQSRPGAGPPQFQDGPSS